MHDRVALHTLVFNSLEEEIAVIDQAGVIIDVNSAWTKFGLKNGLSIEFTCVGHNYLNVVQHSFTAGDALAGEAAKGILDVISGKCASFYHEYPCHSPIKKRWFMMRVTRLKGDSRSLFIISHYDITKRRLAEERAEHLARHDPLTGLANRRYFKEFLDREVRRSVRSQLTISLVLIDADHFKDYNDELGHAAGDLCLVKISQVLLAFSRRSSDLAARLGGDEFAVILGETKIEKSRTIADTIRKTINDLKLDFGRSRQVTASLGVATINPNKQQTEDFLFQEADKALYHAKSTGRDRMVHAQSSVVKRT